MTSTTQELTISNNTTIIFKIITKIYEYQEKHDITDMCIPNSLFVYHLFKTYTNLDVEVKSVILFNRLSVGIVLNTWGHLIVKVNGNIIEPSLQYYQYEGNVYSETYKEFMGKFEKKHMENFKQSCDVKDLLTTLMRFKEKEKLINENSIDVVLKKFEGNPKMNSYYKKLIKYTKDLMCKLEKL